LLDFWKAHPQETAGKLALIIGSGLGDDAEQLAAWGFQTTAFDISETAIRATHKRFPNSAVDYLTADLLNPPSGFLRKFDFVHEVYTLQALRVALRPSAIKALTGFLRPGGLLLVVARGREPSDPKGQMPWPLMRSEPANFVASGLHQISFEDYPDPQDPAVRRFRALYSRAS
jgi:SAM-dependent methyltransferase